MAGRLIMEKPPQLIAPYIMIGMKGWLNAADLFMLRKLKAFRSLETYP